MLGGLGGCELRALPNQLPALTGLVKLMLAMNESLGQMEQDGWGLLSSVLSLTWLDLGTCGLRDVPPQLAALPHLVELSLEFNSRLGEHGDAVFGPLQQAAALMQLNLAGCGLLALPSQLEAMVGLVQLRLNSNWG